MAVAIAPTRSSAELKQLLGEDFAGILSSDCFSAYNPQSASAQQKCLTHLERDFEALKQSSFDGNRLLAEAVSEILATARTRYREYHAGQLSSEAMAAQRLVLESQLPNVLINAPVKGWPADAQRAGQPDTTSLDTVVYFFR